MDLLTHSLLTAILIDKHPTTVVAGLGPDIPWYLTYPVWVVATGQAQHALVHSDWPDPPAWIQVLHDASHSIPVALAATIFVRAVTGHWPRKEFAAWTMHILVDIPTHSRRFWGPHFLWPFTDFSVDGVPWAEMTSRWLAKGLRRWHEA